MPLAPVELRSTIFKSLTEPKKTPLLGLSQQLNQKLPEIKAKYVDLENKYFAKLEALDQQQKELSAQQTSLRSLEENLIRKSMELDEREQHYNDVEAALIQKIKTVSADAERTNIQIDAFNELAEATRRIEPELRRQIEVLSASNERLKGLVGRLMPYKWVTRQMLQERDPHISAITAELLETATKNLRSRQRNVAPSGQSDRTCPIASKSNFLTSNLRSTPSEPDSLQCSAWLHRDSLHLRVWKSRRTAIRPS